MSFFMAYPKRFWQFIEFIQSRLSDQLLGLNFKSLLGCRHQKFCRGFFEIILQEKEFPGANCFWIYQQPSVKFRRIKKVKNIHQLGFDFAIKTYYTLKMFLLSAQNNFLYYIKFICRRAQDKKFKSETYVCSWFPDLQNLDVFFGKLTVEQVLNFFPGRKNSLELPVLGFCDSLPYDLEETIELRALISWVLGLQAFRNFVSTFELPLWIYQLL